MRPGPGSPNHSSFMGQRTRVSPEEPVFSSYYKLGAFNYKKGDGTEYSDDPCLEGIDFGCRTSVLFSPNDLSCLWEQANVPKLSEKAFQLGANLNWGSTDRHLYTNDLIGGRGVAVRLDRETGKAKAFAG